MPFIRLLIIAGLLLALTACGSRFFYNQLDWLVPWAIRDYVSLDNAQQSLLQKHLNDRLAWHCSTQLPGYVAWLRTAESSLQAEQVTPETLSVFTEQLEHFWRELMLGIVPDVAIIMATASDAQVEELFANLHARNEEIQADYIDAPLAEQQNNRAERMERRLRRWFGRLNPEQRARVAAWSSELHPISEQWLENRRHWQTRLRAALNQRDPPPQFKTSIVKLLVYPDADWPQQYREQLEENRAFTVALLVDLYELASDYQRERLASRIDSFARGFETVSCLDHK